MNESEVLAARFEADRDHLRQVAQRILGSAHEAEDAVQETWLRLSRAETAEVGNLTGWLTTVVSRICLDMLRSRTARREDLAELPPDAVGETSDPEHEAVLADAIGPALLLVLDTLGPSERLAFVLHDLFAVPFPQIAEIVGCSPAAARQLASRARRRVQGRSPDGGEDTARRRAVVEAFLTAARGGDFAGLLAVLDPEAVLRVDEAAVRMGAVAPAAGARAVAETFNGKARAASLMTVDGQTTMVWQHRGAVKVVFAMTLDGDRITAIDLVADPERIAEMRIGRA